LLLLLGLLGALAGELSVGRADAQPNTGQQVQRQPNAASPAPRAPNQPRPVTRAVPAPVDAEAYSAASRWTLGLLTSGIDGTSLQMAVDLARILNDGPELRLIPMVGESSIQNVMDLLYLKGADLAVVQSDVLAQLKRTKRLPGIEERIQYITKLHSEEFHVLSRMKYFCLADLAGRKVNFGPEGSGSALTAEAVFGAHQVKVQPLYMDQATAIEKLKSGEIDATVLVSGKPSTAFEKIRYTDRVHFLDVDFGEALQKDYLPAIMTNDDYPDLIAPNETVGTIAVSAVLAVVNAKPGSDQHNKVSRFVERFFAHLDELRQPTRHAKWQEVNPALPLTGWVRFSAAQQWLASNPVQPTAASVSPSASPEPAAPANTANAGDLPTNSFGQAAESASTTQSVASPTPAPAVVAGAPGEVSEKTRELFQSYLQKRDASSGGDREELFNEFVRWYQQKNAN
jgi:TRAP transporter TAXI family solute receptor